MRKDRFTLRPAHEADRDAIAAIWRAGASLPGVGPADMPSPADFRRRVDMEFASGWVVVIAARGEDVLGFLALRPASAILAELFIRPEEIGAGIGRALLAEAMRAMPKGFTLYTRSANANARLFYERNGLWVQKQDVHPTSGDPIVHYEWQPN